jgi:hypothetical protein
LIRSLVLTTAALVLAAGLALAEPEVQVRYFDGVPEISITGDYPGARYTIWRAAAPSGPFGAMTSLDILCLGTCFGSDYAARPGETYWYRFDLALGDGSTRTFGPFPVTISPVLARSTGVSVHPNPMRAAGRIELFLSGAPGEAALDASAMLFDLQGRRVKTLWKGPLSRGLTRVAWDGRDDAGRALGPGAYFVRFATPHGVSIQRIVRIQ